MGARGRRTGIVLILIIIIVLVAGIALVAFLGNVIGGGVTGGGAADATVTPIPTPTPPPTVPVIVAARDIPRGARLTAQDVTIMRWPVLADAPPPPNALIPDEDPEDPSVIQLSVERMIEGRITRLSSVGYALREGDHVDILMSFRFVDIDEEFQTILPNNVGVVVLPGDLVPDEQSGAEGEIGFSIVGREEDGPFGTPLLVIPSSLDGGYQRPRQTAQLIIDNAIVLRMGTWSLGDLDQPIVITAAPPATAAPTAAGATPEAAVTPTPPPIPIIPVPDIVTLVLSRQDALVLKYALEVGADIDMVLRSAFDDDINDIVTDPVTLQYLIDNYRLEPPRLGISHEPRIDLLSGGFLPFLGGGEEAAPAEATPAP